MTLIASIVAGAMTLSAFTNAKQETQKESTRIKGDCDDWKLYRDNVAYCSGVDEEKGVCAGTDGRVWLNTNTEQLVIIIRELNAPCHVAKGDIHDLSYTTKHDGYNYRFYMDGQYYYINITVPRSRYY